MIVYSGTKRTFQNDVVNGRIAREIDSLFRQMGIGRESIQEFDYPTSSLSIKGRRINYYSFIKSHEYKECDEAIERIKKRIDIVKILELIDDVSCIDDDYKQFLKILINKRCEVFLGI